MREHAHRLMCRVVEGSTGNPEIDDAPYLLLLLPRDWGKCHAASSRILTADGTYRRGDSLRVGDRVRSMTPDWQMVWREVVAVEEQPAAPVYRITMTTGRTLTVSGNHPIRQWRGWTPARNLTPGARVAVTRRTPEPESPVPCPAAAFLGYMIGDGACGRAAFTNADEAVRRDFARAAAHAGCTTSEVRPTGSGKCPYVNVQGARPVLRAAQMEGCDSYTKRIPEQVFRSPNEDVGAFLRAYFSCDGALHDWGVELYSVARELLVGVQSLLLRLGILSQVSRKHGQYKGQPHLSWRLKITAARSVRRFAEQVGFTGHRAVGLAALLERMDGTYETASSDTVPPEWRDDLPTPRNRLRTEHGIRIDNQYGTSWDKAERAAAVMGMPRLLDMRETVFWDAVKTVEVLPPEPTYAVEVDGDPVYCVDDVITHNSATVTKALPIQYLLRDPNTAGLIFNEKMETAAQFLESIKYTFDSNELFRSLFPELIPPSKQDTTWSGTKIKIQRTTGRSEASVMVSGVGAAIAGNHPDFLIVDDMISREAAESARRGSWEIMEGVNRWVHTLEALLSSGSAHTRRIIFIGTRWYHNDCYDHLKDYFGYGQEPKEWQLTIPIEDGQRQTLPVKRYGDLVVFERSVREDGQWSWPEKYDEDRMLRMQAQDPILYAANFLNNPSNAANATFKDDWLKTYRWLDKQTLSYVTPAGVRTALQIQQMDRYMMVDPGGFGKGTEDRARSALWVMGHTPTGEHLFLDCWSEKDTYIACQKQIIAKARQYGVRKIGIEREGQQVVFIDQVRRLLREAGMVDVVVEELKTDGKAKDDRILLLETYFQRGLCYVGTGAIFSEFRTQYSQFPRSARRDLLDALAYLPKMIRPRTATTLGDRRAAELRAYYQKRGVARPA